MMIVHSTICPGCSLGCGLYLTEAREEEVSSEKVRLSVLHRKVSPVNAGKLCKFGMQLPRFYARSRVRATIEGKEAKVEDAVKEVKERFTTMRPDEIALIAFPSTMTNEEILALLSLGESLGCKNIVTGFERFYDVYDITTMRTLDEIENAKKILLFFFDPFVHYPLITRRILRAKEKGAKIIDVSFAEHSTGIADETLIVDEILQSTPPSSMGDVAWDVANVLVEDKNIADALVIADLDPMTEVRFLEAVSRISSNVFLLKPFLNANGAILLSSALKYRGNMDIFDVINAVRDGKIKGLYVFESSLSVFFSDFADVEMLVVHDAFESELCRKAHITIPSDAFFMKRGTVVNAEGRVLYPGGDSSKSVDVINEISGAYRSYDEVHEHVKSCLKFSKESEYNEFVEVARQKRTSGKKGGARGGAGERKGGSASGRKEGGKAKTSGKGGSEETTHLLLYKTNPFFWWNGEKNFVEISPETARELHLFRGEKVVISSVSSERDMERVSFKISEIPQYLIVSESKLSVSDRILSPVKIRAVKRAQ